MLTSVDILNRLKAKFGSDYKTAKCLEVPQSRITKIRTMNGTLTDEQGLKAAEILGLKPDFIIMSLTAERAERSPAYSILRKIADKLEPKNIAASLALLALFTVPNYAPFLTRF